MDRRRNGVEMATTMGGAPAPIEAEKGLAAPISTATTKKLKKSRRTDERFLA